MLEFLKTVRLGGRGFVLAVLLGAFCLQLHGQTAQPTVLYSFAATPQIPNGELAIGQDGNIYGTTSAGGTNGGFGTLFKITVTNGTVSNLVSFDWINANPRGRLNVYSLAGFYIVTTHGGSGAGGISEIYTNSSLIGIPPLSVVSWYQFFSNGAGANPNGDLTVIYTGTSSKSYGTTSMGGTYDCGTIFVSPPGNFPATLINFNHTNGANPCGPLFTLGVNTGYGVTVNGGAYGLGTVFSFTTAGVLSTLISFNSINGANPECGLVGSNSIYYGTTFNGGTNGFGTIFKITGGSTVSSIFSFNGTNGANPGGTLFEDGAGNLYGTTSRGGTNGNYGTIFELTSGGVFKSLFSFSQTNGAYPQATLLQATDHLLYGTTPAGGPNNGCGTVFRISTNGDFTMLTAFNSTPGQNPASSLMQGADGNLYGTTTVGGTNGGNGTVFQSTTKGVFTPLYSFGGSDGAQPYGALVQAPDGTLLGTTRDGGTNGGYGTAFRMTTNGVLTSLVSFGVTNGASPCSGLVAGLNGSYYGTTLGGGALGYGTIYRISPSGAFASLFSFNGTNGGGPYSSMTFAPDGSLYGTTTFGGSNGTGTVFRFTTNGVFTSLASFPNSGESGTPLSPPVIGADGSLYVMASQANPNPPYGNDHGYGSPANPEYLDVFNVTTNGVLTSVASYGTYGTIPPAEPAFPFQMQGGLLAASDGSIYLTVSGGSVLFNKFGSIQKISGNKAMVVASFNVTNGTLPFAPMIQANDGNFYGTTIAGGASNGGTIFKLSTWPTITSQPTNFSTSCGGSATFSVAATAVMTPLSYQWFRNNTSMDNATNAFLTLSNLSTADSSATFSVTVSNTVGSVSSQTATLTVVDTNPPVIAINGAATTNIALNSPYFDAGATAFDTCAGVVPVATNGAVNTSVVGVYALDYLATDPSGNIGTNYRTVNVLPPSPVQFMASPAGGGFSFATVSGQSYTVEQTTNLGMAHWCLYSNFIGDGGSWQLVLPANQSSAQFFRVRVP